MSTVDGKSDNLDWWYDGQIKRYLTQLVRMFSGFRVREYTKNGEHYNRVPCRYADASRLVSHIMRNNSENIINSAPMITLAIAGIKMDPELRHHPFHTDKTQVAEREWDPTTGEYTNNQGNLYTVEKYMPTPYRLDIQLDIWTTNTDTKLQLMEQMMVLFNPSIQIQTHKNPLDWSSVFEVTMTDLAWSNRSIPSGVDDVLDVATTNFEVTVWLNPPAKVRRQQIIQTIITNIYANEDVQGIGYDSQFYDFFRSIEPDAQVIVTTNDYVCHVEGNTATLLYPNGNPGNWQELIEMQGYLNEGSILKINTTNDIENPLGMISGLISYSSDASVLNFELIPDTLAANTLDPVNKIIDPTVTWPDNGLPAPTIGDRYLITSDMPAAGYWGIVNGVAGDIIQYNGTVWVVVFASSASQGSEYVVNNYTGKQYVYTGTQWQSSYEGTYNPGFWRLHL